MSLVGSSLFDSLTMHYFWSIILALALLFNSCQVDTAWTEIELPTTSSAQPRLFANQGGEICLSWLENLGDEGFSLQYVVLSQEEALRPIEISRSDSWFINWADFPSVVVSKQGWWAAHWLQMSGSGRFDYDVHISTSSDGKVWSPSFIIHKDSVAAEHGFVSMLPLDDGHIMAVWLDGRHTGTPDSLNPIHDHGHYGQMTLRTASFDQEGRLRDENELDNRVCDCCQTAMALTRQGSIVAFRDRSNEEIRDISIIRKLGNDWTQSRTLYNDHWLIRGCPVNGPALAVYGNTVGALWYTEGGEEASVKLAISADNGYEFSAPIPVDNTDPIGRVGIEMDKNWIYVTWIDSGNDLGTLKMAMYDHQGNWQSQEVITEISTTRRSGFPVIKKSKNHLYIAWVELGEDKRTRVRVKYRRI